MSAGLEADLAYQLPLTPDDLMTARAEPVAGPPQDGFLARAEPRRQHLLQQGGQRTPADAGDQRVGSAARCSCVCAAGEAGAAGDAGDG